MRLLAQGGLLKRSMITRVFPLFSLVAAGLFSWTGGGAQEAVPGQVLVQEIEYKVLVPEATPCPPEAGTACIANEVELESLKNFKMNAPIDWDVKFNSGGFAVFMEPKVRRMATPDNPIVADPNIGVMAVRNPLPIDEEGLEEYAQEVELNLNKTEMGIEGEKIFTVFNKTLIDLDPAHRAYLYYVQGTINGLAVRQAILVTSTDRVRYRVSLTDDAVSFDKTLEKYFPIMTSLQLKGPPLKRVTPLEKFAPWILGLLALVGVLFGIRVVLRRRMDRLIAEVSRESPAPSGIVSGASMSTGSKAEGSQQDFPPISDP
jgi:hypothetical protein